jgi:hypothetical protein
MVLLSVGLLFDILVPMMWIMLALTAITAVHRFVMVWRQANDAAAAAPGSTTPASVAPLPSAPDSRVTDDRRRPRSRRLSRVPGRR